AHRAARPAREALPRGPDPRGARPLPPRGGPRNPVPRPGSSDGGHPHRRGRPPGDDHGQGRPLGQGRSEIFHWPPTRRQCIVTSESERVPLLLTTSHTRPTLAVSPDTTMVRYCGLWNLVPWLTRS